MPDCLLGIPASSNYFNTTNLLTTCIFLAERSDEDVEADNAISAERMAATRSGKISSHVLLVAFSLTHGLPTICSSPIFYSLAYL